MTANTSKQDVEKCLNPTCKSTFATNSLTVTCYYWFYIWGTTFVFLVKGRCLNPSVL